MTSTHAISAPPLSLISGNSPDTQQPRPLVELYQVSKVFKTGAGDYPALKNVNLTFRQGEFACIMGKSGSGKSTLMNMITGIDQPSSGTVRVGDVEVHTMQQGELAIWRGRSLGIVFQFFQLLPTLSVLENTLLPMDYGGMYAPEEREPRAMELLRLVGLEDAAYKLPAALSGGQQQIAAIARSLANDPPIIAADEPTGNLDSRTALHILDIFDNLVTQGKTVLIVTHDPALAQRSSRRVLISDGELINEFIAHALPHLPHPLLLKLTQQVSPRLYESGATITRQETLDAGLYLITRGKVEVLRQGRRGTEELLGFLEPGQYLSELEMIETKFCDLHLRVAPGKPVELLAMGLEAFNRFLSDAPAAAHILRQAAVERSTRFCPQMGQRRRPWTRWWKR